MEVKSCRDINNQNLKLYHFEITLQKLYKINVQHYYNSMNEIKSTVSIKPGIFKVLKV